MSPYFRALADILGRAAIVLLPFLVFIVLPVKLVLHAVDAEADVRRIPQVRTIPVFVESEAGAYFVWEHTTDERLIRLCRAPTFPVPARIECAIVVGGHAASERPLPLRWVWVDVTPIPGEST